MHEFAPVSVRLVLQRRFCAFSRAKLPLSALFCIDLRENSARDKTHTAAANFIRIYGKGIMHKLGIREIPADEVCLKPELLEKYSTAGYGMGT